MVLQKGAFFATHLSQNALHAPPSAVDAVRSHGGRVVVLHFVECIPNRVRFVDVLRKIEVASSNPKISLCHPDAI